MSNAFRSRPVRFSIRAVLLLVGMLCTGQISSRAALVTNTWNVDANGTWDLTTDWTPSAAPNSGTNEALFGSKITANRVVTLSGSSFTVGNLTFNNGNQYTITNVGGAFTSGNALTLTQGSFTDTFDQLGAGTVLLNVPISLGSGATRWGGSGTGTVTVNGKITGTGSITKTAGAWMLVLAGANTYSGGTTINVGTVQLGAANATGNGAVTLANTPGAILDLNNFNDSIGNLSGGGTLGGNISLGTGTLTVTQANNLTFGGIISGAGNLTKLGLSTLTLSGVNTFTGTTLINAGTLQVGVANAINIGSEVTLANVSTAILNLNNFNDTIGTLSGGGATGGNISLGSGTLTVNQTSDAAYNGVISGTGNLVKQGTGTLTIGGVNTYSGTTKVTGGILSISADSGLGALPGGTVPASLTLDGGTLQATAGFALGGNGTRGITLGTGGGTIDVAISSAITNVSYLGIIAGPSISDSFTKTGIGALYLGGVNTYLGITTVNGGALSIASDSALGAVPGSAITNSITLDGGTLNSAVTTTVTLNSKRGITLNSGGGSINVYPGFTVNYGGIIAGSGALILTNTGTLVLTGANTYTGDTLIMGGTLRLGGGAAIPDASRVGLTNLSTAILDLNGSSETIGGLAGGAGSSVTLGTGTLTVNQPISATYSGVISGTGGLTKQGVGALALGAASSYSGATIINAGILQAGVANVISNSSSVTLANVSGAIFDLNNFNQGITNLSGGGATGGNITLGSGTLTVNESAVSNYSGVISGSGGVTKQGSAALTLGGANTYTGTTTISAGSLKAGAVNVIASSGTLTLANTSGVVFDLNSFNNTVGTLSGGGATGGNITLGTGTLTINQGGSGSYDGVISGTGAVSKQGSGTLTLTRSNTFTGGVTIGAGTLALNIPGALGTNTLTLNGSGANLQLAYSDNANNALFSNITVQNGTITRTAAANLKSGILDSAHTLTVNGTGTLLDQGNDGTSGYLSVDGAVVVQTGTLTLKALNATDEVRLNKNLTIMAGATAKVDSTGLGTNTFGSGTAIVIEGQGTATSQATLDLGSGISAFNAGTSINLNGTNTGGLKVSGSQAKVDNFLTAGRISTNITMTGGGTLTLAYTDANLNASFSKAPSVGTQARIGFYVPSGSTNTIGAVADDMQKWGGFVVDGPQNDATAIVALGVNENLKGDNSHATTLDILGGDYQLAGGSPVGGKTNTISGTATFSGGIIDGGPGGGSRGLLVVGGDMVIGNTSFGTTGHGLISITMTPAHNTTNTIRPLNAGVDTAMNGSLNLLTISGADSTGTVKIDSHVTSISVTELHVATGTLLLGANNQIGAGAGLVMEGGTLNLNGYNQNFFTLTLSANSHLDFGGTTNTFDFGYPASMSANLIVDDWVTGDKLKSDTAVTTDVLSHIRFGTLLAQLDPTDTTGHTIMPAPVPEPSTVAGIILIGGLLAYRERKTIRRVLSFRA